MTWKLSFVILIIISQLAKFLDGYQLFQNDTVEKDFCKIHETQFFINPDKACCNMNVVTPGISLKEHWNKCASTQATSSNIQQAAWEVYACIVKNANGMENTISLSKFASLYSASYPEAIKSQIIQEAGTMTDTNENIDLTNFDGLKKLRITYFDIERLACNGSTDKDYGKVRDCQEWEESLHRGGMCCGTKGSFPFDIKFNSLMDENQLNFTSCVEKMEGIVLGENSDNANMEISESLVKALAEVCDVSCGLMIKGDMNPTDLKNKENKDDYLKSIPPKLLPSWLPSQVQKDAVNFALTQVSYEKALERMRDYTFSDFVQQNTTNGNFIMVFNGTFYTYYGNGTSKTASHDMNGTAYTWIPSERTFPESILHISTICSAINEVSTFMQMHLENTNCDSPSSSPESTESSESAENTERSEE